MTHHPQTRSSQSGFTLIEILIATAIFALSIFAIVQSRTISLRNVVESENLRTAVMLGQMKMSEMEIKYKKELDKAGNMDSAKNSEGGAFEAPYENFKWKADFKESEVKITGEVLAGLLKKMGVDGDEAQIQAEQMRLVLTNLNKTLKDNFGELTVTISWDAFGRTQKMPLVTHISPSKPKILLTATAED